MSGWAYLSVVVLAIAVLAAVPAAAWFEKRADRRDRELWDSLPHQRRPW